MKDILVDKGVEISTVLNELPENPGVYMYSDENNKVIYVGKAKNLRRRVFSYFNGTKNVPIKTQLMVRKIRKIDYLVVNSEEDAFLLENDLIKQYKPRYNILLKDDKTYPWIVVKNEPFPRVYLTRKKLKNDGSRYYGPYAAVVSLKALIKLITTLYPIRVCPYGLSQENIKKGKYQVCLQYHVKKCLAPCVGLQTEEDYNKNVESIEKILRGKSKEVSKLLYQEMLDLSAEMRFEEAALTKERYDMLELYSAKTLITSPELDDVEVFSFEESGLSVFINYMYIAYGSMLQNCTIELKNRLNESNESVLGLGIIELRSRFESRAKEIVLPFLPDITLNDVTFTVPIRGEKKKLLALSEKNVRQYKMEQTRRLDRLNPEERVKRIVNTLKAELHLKDSPIHIECFDISNIQGTNTVAACVVFKNVKPSKKDYRQYNIRTVDGPDDFHSMYEVVFRRYRRLSVDNMSLPQLVVIDGGKGQLHAAVDALKDLGLYGKIAIIGIAKRLEEIYFPNDSVPIYLSKNSEGLKLIQHLRDEAHRFGITAHRNKRSKQQVTSELDSVKGIGPVVKEALLKEYKSVKRIKETPREEIAELIGKYKAKLLFEGMHPTGNKW